MNEKLEAIRQACIAANPGIVSIRRKKQQRTIGEVCDDDPPIHLADVLLAIMKAVDGRKSSEVQRIFYRLAHLWNCYADDLTQQSVETIEFLYGLVAA